jgi:hypothetical protein
MQQLGADVKPSEKVHPEKKEILWFELQLYRKRCTSNGEGGAS